MKKLIPMFCISLFAVAPGFNAQEAEVPAALEVEEMPAIMPQAYLGEELIDDSKEFAGSKAAGVLKQLEEVRHISRIVKNDLKKGELGDEVQGDESEIVEILAEIIEKNRPKTSKPPEDQEEQEGEKKEGEGKGPPKGAKPGSKPGTGSKPMKDSSFRGGTNAAGELRKFVEEARATWGKLPKKERDRMKQEMKRKLPKSHSDWIEAFTKALNEGTAGK